MKKVTVNKRRLSPADMKELRVSSIQKVLAVVDMAQTAYLPQKVAVDVDANGMIAVIVRGEDNQFSYFRRNIACLSHTDCRAFRVFLALRQVPCFF